MVTAFSHKLHNELSHLSIPSSAKDSVELNRTRLAAIPIPEGLDVNSKLLVERSIEDAFVHAFRLVMLACAGLALLSAIFSWMFIGKRDQPDAILARGIPR
jgi:hypothetical protein